MKPFLLSLGASLVLTAAAFGGFVWFSMTSRTAAVTRGWNLRPVLAVRRALNAGEALTEDALVETPLPEQFVSESTIAVADRALLVGQRPTVALLAGDVLVWGVFAEQAPAGLTTDCIEHIRSVVDEAGSRAAGAAVDAFAQRLGTPLPPPAELPALPTGRDSVEVLVALEDLSEGTDLSARQLTVRRLPQALVTASHIPARFLEQVASARVVVPMQKGDPVLWQMLDDREVPRSAAACTDAAMLAREAARKRVGADEATAFLRSREAR